MIAARDNWTRLKCIFDTNALMSVRRETVATMGIDVWVPIAVVQELIHKLVTESGRGAALARNALLFLTKYENTRLLPFFGDAVRPAFGVGQVYWPGEEAHWRSLMRLVATGKDAMAVRDAWNGLWQYGLTEYPAELFFLMKDNKNSFREQMQSHIDELDSDTRPQSTDLSVDNPAFGSTIKDGTGVERTSIEATFMAIMAALAGVPRFAAGMEQSIGLPPILQDRAIYALCVAAARDYQGGLDFAIRMNAQLQMIYSRGHKHPDGNDYFDFLILASVDDSSALLFVTGEKRMLECAQTLGLAARIAHPNELGDDLESMCT